MKTNLLVSPSAWSQDQLVEIGHLLQATRQTQGHSLEAMAAKTLIRASLLTAIEEGDCPNLPEPVYLRGLIRRYGEAMGLDGQMLASQLLTPPEPQPTQWQDSPAAQLRPFHLYVTYIVLLVAAISGLSYLLRRNAPELLVLPPLDPLSQSQVEKPANQATVTSEAQPAPNRPPASPIEVEMTLTSPSWLRVVTDGTTQFEGILQPGDTRLWQAKQALTIRAGNAGGVMVSYNNNPVTPLGKPGMVQEVTYSPSSPNHNVVSLAY